MWSARSTRTARCARSSTSRAFLTRGRADRETTGLLYAAPFGQQYGLFYFFPLTQLQNELGVVLRTLALVGLALVFLLAGIAWLLTRWVVVPVSRAAQGAQLLSTGKLGERLEVRGQR